MRSRRRLEIVLAVAFVASAFLLAACGNDDPGAPVSVRVTVEVVDAQGDPVPGLDLDTAPDTPFYGEAVARPAAAVTPAAEPGKAYPNPFYPATTLRFIAGAGSLVRLTVEDVDRVAFRTLIEGPVAAGTHSVVWDGRDSTGADVPGGVYYAHLAIHETATDSLLADQRDTLLLARLGSGGFAVGTTDADGRIVLDDDRLFPYLHGVAPFAAYDENADPVGTITLTPAVRFYFHDPGTGQRRHWTRDVTGTTTLRFVWDPAP